MEKIVPALSSSATGPLGVVHLPRLWLKATLNATGSLADGWNSGNRGMDKWLMDDLEIEFEPFFAFLKTLPTYRATEAWVQAHAGKIDAAAIAAHNARVLDFDVAPDVAATRRASVGLTDTAIARGVMLNDLDDWMCAHAIITADRGKQLEPIVPLVSMHTVGPLGIKHLPRMWMKGIIHGAGALPDQWRSGPVRVVYTDGRPALVEAPGGVDAMTCTNIGLDLLATAIYLRDEQPGYLAFEDWVRAHATKLDPASIAAHHAGPWVISGEKAVTELARLGYPEMTTCDMFLYNDFGDWDAIRQQMLGRRSAGAR